MANFNPEFKVVLDDMLLGYPFVRPGKMFGFPAYYVRKPKMRAWVQINLSRAEEYRLYQSTFEESLHHLLAQQEEGNA